MIAWKLFNVFAIVFWVLNAIGIVTAYMNSAPVTGSVASASVAGMVLGIMHCAECIWPKLGAAR